MDPCADDLLAPRLTAYNLRRHAGMEVFQGAMIWLAAHPDRRLVRTRDGLEVGFSEGVAVQLLVSGLGFSITCSCGLLNGVCVHAIAGGLAWLEREGPPGGPWGLWRLVKPKDEFGSLVGRKTGSPIEAFDNESDDHASQRFFRLEILRRARQGPNGPELAHYRHIIEALCCRHALVAAPNPNVWLQGIAGAVEACQALVEEPDPAAGITLLEYAVCPIYNVIRFLPDDAETIDEVVSCVVSAHIRGCERAPQDPIRVARWLAFSAPLWKGEIAPSILYAYKGLIGKRGVAEARRIQRLTVRQNKESLKRGITPSGPPSP